MMDFINALFKKHPEVQHECEDCGAECRNPDKLFLPCPFCGGKAKILAYETGGLCVRCMECSCQTNTYYDYCIDDCKRLSAFEKAVAAWNTRPKRDEYGI